MQLLYTVFKLVSAADGIKPSMQSNIQDSQQMLNAFKKTATRVCVMPINAGQQCNSRAQTLKGCDKTHFRQRETEHVR